MSVHPGIVYVSLIVQLKEKTIRLQVKTKYSGDPSPRHLNARNIQILDNLNISDKSGIQMPFEYPTKFSLVFRAPFDYRTSIQMLV